MSTTAAMCKLAAPADPLNYAKNSLLPFYTKLHTKALEENNIPVQVRRMKQAAVSSMIQSSAESSDKAPAP